MTVHDNTPPQATVPPTVALRADQPVVLGAAAAPDWASVEPWANAAARVEAALQAQEAGTGALAWAMVVFFTCVLGRPGTATTVVMLATLPVLIIGSIWLLRVPRAWVLAALGIAMLVFAAWLAIDIGFGAIIPIAAVAYWGVRRLFQAHDFRKVLRRETTAAHLREVGRAVEEVREQVDCPDAIRLHIESIRDIGRWRLMLLPDVALVLQKRLGAVTLVALPKPMLTIEPTGRRNWSGRLRVRLTAGGHTWRAAITDAHLHRYLAWQAGSMPDDIRAAVRGER